MTLGAASAPTVVGVNPWGSEAEVWARAVGIAVESPQTPATRRGNGTEQACAAWFLREHGFYGEPGPPHTAEPFRNPKLPHLHCHPDLLVWEAPFDVVAAKPRLFDSHAEVKTSRYLDPELVVGGRVWPGWGPPESGRFPKHVAVQVVVQLAVLERDHGWLVAWGTVDDDFRVYRVERNLRAEKGIVDATAAWWERHVVKGHPPDPDGKRRTSRALDQAIEAVEGKRVVATVEDAALVEKLRTLRAKRKEIEAHEEMLRQQLRLRMGDAEELLDARGRRVVTWKGSPRRLRLAHEQEDEDG